MIFLSASSRPNGHTNQIIQFLARHFKSTYIDIAEKDISYYDYEHKNEGDDFIGIAEKLTEHDVIVLGTPVYWYSMSAQMKTFIDRWSDLVTVRKDLGRALKGKTLMVVSCGSRESGVDGFEMPFEETAKYMDMQYAGHFPTWLEEGEELVHENIQNRLNLLANSINKSIKEIKNGGNSDE